MKYYKMDFTEENIPKIMANINDAIILQTNNIEYWIEKEIEAKDKYMEALANYKKKYAQTLLKILAGEIKTNDKQVAQSIADKVAKAHCWEEEIQVDITKSQLESIHSRKDLEVEKLYTLKKLIEDRKTLGG